MEWSEIMERWNNFNTNPIGRMSGAGNPYGINNYMPAQRYEIIRVNGEAGAKNFRMAPNSNALLLDDTAAIIWVAQTDGTGYLTVTPYDVFPHQQVPPVDVNNLAARVAQLEEIINAKSNTFSNKQSKKQRQHADSTNESASNTTD